MRASFLFAPLLVAAVVVAAPRPAAASTTYPQAVSDALGMFCVPQCTICHTTNLGGLKTATKPFAVRAQALGLMGGENVDLLRTTLGKMGAENSDGPTDPDTDLVELQDGKDPNVVGGDVCTGPRYGCGASTIAPVSQKRAVDPTALGAAALSALIGLLLLRRRRS